jgi:hypothetical protein
MCIPGGGYCELHAMAEARAEQSSAAKIKRSSTSHSNRRYGNSRANAATRKSAADYRPAGKEALAAIRVSAGVAAILTSTSLTGFSVQACVT